MEVPNMTIGTQRKTLAETNETDATSAADDQGIRRTRMESSRPAENVETWMAYLPQDCVAAMVKMGWDRDT
jgi:hypothetical protein